MSFTSSFSLISLMSSPLEPLITFLSFQLVVMDDQELYGESTSSGGGGGEGKEGGVGSGGGGGGGGRGGGGKQFLPLPALAALVELCRDLLFEVLWTGAHEATAVHGDRWMPRDTAGGGGGGGETKGEDGSTSGGGSGSSRSGRSNGSGGGGGGGGGGRCNKSILPQGSIPFLSHVKRRVARVMTALYDKSARRPLCPADAWIVPQPWPGLTGTGLFSFAESSKQKRNILVSLLSIAGEARDAVTFGGDHDGAAALIHSLTDRERDLQRRAVSVVGTMPYVISACVCLLYLILVQTNRLLCKYPSMFQGAGCTHTHTHTHTHTRVLLSTL
jgi:hypothetical protein